MFWICFETPSVKTLNKYLDIINTHLNISQEKPNDSIKIISNKSWDIIWLLDYTKKYFLFEDYNTEDIIKIIEKKLTYI